ncbi:MAG: DUF1553 domain-containing protein [Gemmataceae bacterium]|nr:DUF1553 domain-containing protein [Gemmataceae bacterium]
MVHHRYSMWAAALLVAGIIITSSPVSAADPQPVRVAELKVEPATLNLSGPRDSRRFIVRGKTDTGAWLDLTGRAVLQANGDAVRIDAGFVVPVKDGKAEIIVKAGDKQVSLPVTVTGQAAAAPVSFVRDIMPILGKTGCNAGTCHGGQKGRNGFKLSLRGYDPAFDHEQMVDDISGRRIDLKEPANSLVLLKPTQGVPHEGKLVFDEKSRYYKLMQQWIAEGCPSDVATAKRVERLEVLPQLPVLSNIGHEQQLVVVAYYPDGTSQDVTRDAVYSSSTDTICSVSGEGLVKAVRKGDSAILIRYEGQFAVNPVSVLIPNPNYKWTNPPTNNYVDTLVYQKLQRIQVTPSDLCSDSDFLRRIYLDFLGIPPTPEEVQAFLADKRETQLKRREVIDKLLDRPEYVDFWTMRLADLMQVNRKYLGEKGVWSFRDWIGKQVESDRPWNETAHDLLTGVGSTVDAPNSAFFRIAREPGQAVENTTHLFLGIRFNCNKCHDHPFERWTWNDYYHLAAYFSQVGIRKSTTDDEVVYQGRDGGDMRHPKGQVMPPKFPYMFAGAEKTSPKDNRREQLARWITAKENPYFAKAMANRLWAYLNGRGIIDPVDDIRAGNPPSNAELLDALTADFIKHNFSIKHMLRTIANSRTYQLSIVPNATNGDDSENFSHARPRRLTAEQLLDSVRAATGTKNRFPGLPVGFRASQLPDPAAGRDNFLKQFGQPIRESPCECERRNEMSQGQALELVNGPTLSGAVADPAGRVAKVFQAKPDDKQVIEAIYLSVLSRPPTEQESARFVRELVKAPNKQEWAQDLMWALLNTPAFLFNR